MISRNGHKRVNFLPSFRLRHHKLVFLVTAKTTMASIAPPEVDFCSKYSNSISRVKLKARYARATHFKLFCRSFAVWNASLLQLKDKIRAIVIPDYIKFDTSSSVAFVYLHQPTSQQSTTIWLFLQYSEHIHSYLFLTCQHNLFYSFHIKLECSACNPSILLATYIRSWRTIQSHFLL